jgi:hypothetical protein
LMRHTKRLAKEPRLKVDLFQSEMNIIWAHGGIHISCMVPICPTVIWEACIMRGILV